MPEVPRVAPCPGSSKSPLLFFSKLPSLSFFRRRSGSPPSCHPCITSTSRVLKYVRANALSWLDAHQQTLCYPRTMVDHIGIRPSDSDPVGTKTLGGVSSRTLYTQANRGAALASPPPSSLQPRTSSASPSDVPDAEVASPPECSTLQQDVCNVVAVEVGKRSAKDRQF